MGVLVNPIQIIGSDVLLQVEVCMYREEKMNEIGERREARSVALLDLHLATILNLVFSFENEAHKINFFDKQ